MFIHSFSVDSDKGHQTLHINSPVDLSGLCTGPHLRQLILQFLVQRTIGKTPPDEKQTEYPDRSALTDMVPHELLS